jgi:hypothetical protein
MKAFLKLKDMNECQDILTVTHKQIFLTVKTAGASVLEVSRFVSAFTWLVTIFFVNIKSKPRNIRSVIK